MSWTHDWRSDECPGPGKLWDADGNELGPHVVRANIDTGKIEVQIFHENGNPLIGEDDVPVTVIKIHRPPLVFVPLKDL